MNYSQIVSDNKLLTKENAELGMQLLKQCYNISDSFALNCIVRCKELKLTNRQFCYLIKEFMFYNTGHITLANFFNGKNKPEPGWMK